VNGEDILFGGPHVEKEDAMAEPARKRQSAFAEHPEYKVEFVPTPKRVRAMLGGATVADSTRAMIMRETRHTPVYYFPREDVRIDLLTRTDHGTYCPFKGDASYWTLAVGGRTAENAVWSYEDPFDEVAEIEGYLALYWGRMDAWYEEDEEVFVHPRDPFVRIDLRESRRPVRVILAGETVAETTRARFLFETGLPVRYYIPADDVRTDLLQPSEKRTGCPYKGFARYWSADVGGQLYEDIVWSYPDPCDEAARIRDYLCFYDERVDRIDVGEPA